MEEFDIVIIGGATSGAYLARKLAQKGLSVKIIEALSKKNLGTRLDIFHIAREDFAKFNLPLPVRGDKEWAFEFTENYTSSPYNNYPKKTFTDIVGLHMHEYNALLLDYAVKEGVVIEYGAKFREFLFDANGKINGVKYSTHDGAKTVGAKVVIDASGCAAVGRRALPRNYGVETFALQGNDMFYVILYYVKFISPVKNNSWPFYKTWIAPCANDEEKIIGIGACNSYEQAERIYKDFITTVPPEEHTVVRVEKGTTPYTRPPYSFVADNFIITGDAACLTKPLNGEGVTSSMVQMDIIADVLPGAIRNGVTDAKALWKINTEYNRVQGADFAGMRAVLTKAVKATKDEFEYFFEHDIIFSERLMNAASGADSGIAVSDIASTLGGLAGAVVKKKLSKKTIKSVSEGVLLYLQLRQHYMNFPDSPEKLGFWAAKADKLWKKTGKME